MKAGKFASFIVTDPAGIYRDGEKLEEGETFGGRLSGVHVSRWLAAGRIRELPAKTKPKPGR